jgi:hypothetical protein
MFIKINFSINKYSQAFDSIITIYGGMAKLITLDQCVGFLEESYNFSFTGADFHK